MRLLDARETAGRLGVSLNTVYGLCNARQLRHVRIGLGRGRLFVPEDAIAEYLRLKTVQADGGKAPPAGVFTH